MSLARPLVGALLILVGLLLVVLGGTGCCSILRPAPCNPADLDVTASCRR